jgi:ubiquinone/menaquinone biosynthesis C-methylase UbiE
MTERQQETQGRDTPGSTAGTSAGISAWIEGYYDQQAEAEWQRLERHRTEFAVSERALLEHLPPPPAHILDCGGGPGRYAIALAQRGYRVTLFDLSAQNLRLARHQADNAGQELAGYEQGTALDLSRFAADTFDAVLLMGPLYHLLQESERRQALRQACRVLKPGGPLFAAFVTRYAVVRYSAAHEPYWPLEEPAVWKSVLDAGILPPEGEQSSTFVVYGALPAEIPPLLCDTGLEMVSLLGVEGMVSMIEETVNALTGPAWEFWSDLNYRAASDPSLHGAVEHLLAIAVKPRWRAVLRQIAARLQSAGIPFRVVGGTAAALHGVPVPVQDIDLEMSAADVYRFHDIYAAHTIEPPALQESDAYRSHFGRYELDGVQIEVMGDLHRREGTRWVPSFATTQTTLDIEGTPCSVSCLEEETLAYIRRGRLDRASRCLSHCDHNRLTQLLRAEIHTQVL